MPLVDLPPEVLSRIFECIFEIDKYSDDSQPDDIAALLRTNRYCYNVAKPIFYRGIGLSSRKSLKLLARTLAADRTVAPLVEQLRLNLHRENRAHVHNIEPTPNVLHMLTHLRLLSLYDFHDIIDHLQQPWKLFPHLEECSLSRGKITRLAGLKSLWTAPQLKILVITDVDCLFHAQVETDLGTFEASPGGPALAWLCIENVRNLSTKESRSLANLRPVRKINVEHFEGMIPTPIKQLIEDLSPTLEGLFYKPYRDRIPENLPLLGRMRTLTFLGVSGQNLLHAIASRGDSLPRSIVELDIEVECVLALDVYALLEDIIRKRDRCTPRLRMLKLWCPSRLGDARVYLDPDIGEIESEIYTNGIDLEGLQRHQELKTECERIGIELVIEDWSIVFDVS